MEHERKRGRESLLVMSMNFVGKEIEHDKPEQDGVLGKNITVMQLNDHAERQNPISACHVQYEMVRVRLLPGGGRWKVCLGLSSSVR